VRYAKRGRLRFASHRDFQRALERALRHARIPIAYSGGFTRHPKISYVGAAPTGTASEAEYLELGLREPRDPAGVAADLTRSLPEGFPVLEVVEAGPDSLPGRIEAARWRVELPGVELAAAQGAVAAFLAATSVPVHRVTKAGRRELDARAAVLNLTASWDGCVILDLVVRLSTPAVRPDDVLAGLRAAASLSPQVPPRVTRLAQGRLEQSGELADPLTSAG
jgi:radical SAM-linked protein